MASGEEATVPLKYKTWVLKVPIHCEGCNRKVKKVLQSIEGVYTTWVDSQQQKVTVAGNVESDVLIKKLVKTGKHAELWPEKPQANNNKKEEAKGGEAKAGGKEKVQPKCAVDSKGSPDGKEKEEAKSGNKGGQRKGEAAGGKQVADGSGEVAEVVMTPKKAVSPGKNGEAVKGGGGGKEGGKTPKKEGGGEAPQEKQGGGGGGGGEGGEAKGKGGEGDGGGSSGKKKGNNKGQKGGNNNGGVAEGGGGGGETAAPLALGGGPTTNPLLCHQQQQHGFPHFPAYLPQSVYAVNYNMAHPASSYGYYAPPPLEPAGHGYLCYPMQPQQPVVGCGGAYYYPPHLPPPPAGLRLAPAGNGSYDVFSEENANACSIM